jgi:hypothetical protein
VSLSPPMPPPKTGQGKTTTLKDPRPQSLHPCPAP